MLNVVKQKDSSGCGLACVAMLVNKDYDEVKHELLSSGIMPNHWNESVYQMTGNQLFNALQYLGLKCDEPETALPDNMQDFVRLHKDTDAIVAVSNPSGMNGHGLVFCAESGRLIDPLSGSVVDPKEEQRKVAFCIRLRKEE